LRTGKGLCFMTPSDQAPLLLRKASPDLAALTPFSTVFRYDVLPFEDVPDRHSWPPLLHSLLVQVWDLVDTQNSATQEGRS
jgi:hypothetical protein